MRSVQTQIEDLRGSMARLKARVTPPSLPVIRDEDRARFSFFDPGCPCGLPAGECHEHPRARESQRPPAGDWRTWFYCAGRGSGKTFAACQWVQSRVESGVMRLGCLISPTANDLRDVLIDGPSGLLATSPPWCKARFEASKRRVSWPNGSYAICITGEEPERARGLNIDTLLCDEMACWSRGEQTWKLAQLALRAGPNPQSMISTTPRRLPFLKKILEQPTTVQTTDSTYANKSHLAPAFLEQILATFENTRLGEQELHARWIDVDQSAWFSRFERTKHVSESAEYKHWLPVWLGIDCGLSQTTGACFIQTEQIDRVRHRVTVFGDALCEHGYAAENARLIKAIGEGLPCQGRLDGVVLDPNAVARSGLGPAAFGEFEAVFTSRLTSKAPLHSVLDGLDQLTCLLETGCLVIHPRCEHLIEAMQNYRRKSRGGILLDEPAESQSPAEDLCDALRYVVRSRFPEGRAEQPNYRRVHFRELF